MFANTTPKTTAIAIATAVIVRVRTRPERTVWENRYVPTTDHCRALFRARPWATKTRMKTATSPAIFDATWRRILLVVRSRPAVTDDEPPDETLFGNDSSGGPVIIYF